MNNSINSQIKISRVKNNLNLLTKKAVTGVLRRSYLPTATRPFMLGGWLLLAYLSLIVNPAWAKVALHLNFNGTEPSWNYDQTDRSVQLLQRKRLYGIVHGEGGGEKIVLKAKPGYSIPISHPIGQAPVVAETKLRLRVLSNVGGGQIAARVVFPRSLDPLTQLPRRMILRGKHYEADGRWQTLEMDNIPLLLSAQVYVLRTQPGLKVDLREAYIESLVYLVPGGPVPTEVLLDWAEVEGPLQNATAASLSENNIQLQNQPEKKLRKKPLVRWENRQLFVKGRAFYPRMIQLNGESFKNLKAIGFNTVWLDRFATPQQLADAEEYELWLVCPLPGEQQFKNQKKIEASFDRVIAWSVHESERKKHPRKTLQNMARIRRLDMRGTRPIVLYIEGESKEKINSRDFDILCVTTPLASQQQTVSRLLKEFQKKRKQASYGISFWGTIPTEIDKHIESQCRLLAMGRQLSSSAITLAQMHQHLIATCGNECRGVLFTSRKSLAAPQENNQRRTDAVKLINMRLSLLRPWLIAGHRQPSLESQNRRYTAIVLQVERAKLVLPFLKNPKKQQTPATPQNLAAFIIPGIPEPDEAYQITLTELKPIERKRIAGGVWVTKGPDNNPYPFFLLTQDQQVVSYFKRRLKREAKKIVFLQRTLLHRTLQGIEQSLQTLNRYGLTSPQTTNALISIHKNLQQVETQFAVSNYGIASDQAALASSKIKTLKENYLHQATKYIPYESWPISDSLESLVDLLSTREVIQSLLPAENLLAAGDFEDLSKIQKAGWKNHQVNLHGISTRLNITSETPRFGSYSLEFSANPTGTFTTAGLGETIRVSSPTIRASKNMTLEISGWVRVTNLAGQQPGKLTIEDNLGGTALGLGVTNTAGRWKQFRLIRVIPKNEILQLNFAFSGFGTAAIDGIMVRSLHLPKSILPTKPKNKVNIARQKQNIKATLFSSPKLR